MPTWHPQDLLQMPSGRPQEATDRSRLLLMQKFIWIGILLMVSVRFMLN
jgi:hypothetical protein